MPHVYVSDPIHPDVLDDLHRMGRVSCGYGENAVTFADVAANIDAVLLRAETFDAAKITAAPQMRIIARHGAGTDNVDIATATSAGIWVTTTPGANSSAVAEHVFALTLTLARRTSTAATGTANGQWSTLKPTLTGFELGGRVMGLVGFGRIARHVARIAKAFGMTIIAADPHVDTAAIEADGVSAVALPELFAQADVISLHAPLTQDTKHLINRDVLATIRYGAIVVNTSRGELIDEQALVEALDAGRLRGAAIDVVEGESVDMRDPLQHSYLSGHLARPDLIVTPHVAGQTDEALLAAGTGALTCIRQVLADQTPENAVNDVPAPRTIAC